MVETRNEGGSFRDPAGFVFRHKQKVYRQINHVASEDYELLLNSGLYARLVNQGLLVEHKEVKLEGLEADKQRYKIIRPKQIPFVSYPYEWTFLQLKQAALTTLTVMKLALENNMILKDASAYNVQFIGDKPVFIDTLSLTKYTVGDQWEGYKQFCEHFIAPLAVARYASPAVLKTLRDHLDGMPLDLACKLLPQRARVKSGLLAHLYLHNASQRRHQQGGEAVAKKAHARRMTTIAMQGLLSSLERTIKKLTPPKYSTEWGDYYSFTNYSDKAFQAKRELVNSLLDALPNPPTVAWDIGANNGEFSELAAERGVYTVAFDIDEVAVSRNYLAKRPPEIKAKMLPLVQDMTNPSPSLGWAHEERMSLAQRGPADVVMALAIIHHLAIGNNLPFDHIASYLSKLGRHLIIEFVPKGDSKVDHLLASRKDIFGGYTQKQFEVAMDAHFTLVEKKSVKESKRSLYLYKAR
jgi:ribosomal protein L11 methylase PrmA